MFWAIFYTFGALFSPGRPPYPISAPCMYPLKKQRIGGDQQKTSNCFFHPKIHSFWCFSSILVVFAIFYINQSINQPTNQSIKHVFWHFFDSCYLWLYRSTEKKYLLHIFYALQWLLLILMQKDMQKNSFAYWNSGLHKNSLSDFSRVFRGPKSVSVHSAPNLEGFDPQILS